MKQHITNNLIRKIGIKCILTLISATMTANALSAGEQVKPGEKPVAYVLEYKDQWTTSTGAQSKLTQAGFEVRELPMDRSPVKLSDSELIFFGSFSSEHPRYKQYMEKYAQALIQYVKKGRTIVQMTQADQTELTPAFLPKLIEAKRSDKDLEKVVILSKKNPLVKGITSANGTVQLDAARTGWECFSQFEGFEILISSGSDNQFPVMMETAVGPGRIILCSMAFDKKSKQTNPHIKEYSAFSKQFFINLQQHVIEVKNQNALPLTPTPSLHSFKKKTPGSWTLALLPDTQKYSNYYPGIFTSQTAWLSQHVEDLNLKYVFHLGDIVDTNSEREWKRAAASMKLLDGKVPYLLAVGNHDYGLHGGSTSRQTYLNDYFPFKTAKAMPTFGGAMEDGKLDNTYHLFEANGQQWIALSLEWAPRKETVAWANKIMEKHSDRLGILVTHAYMNNNEQRFDHTSKKYAQQYNPHDYQTPGEKYDGEELWQNLVRKHRFVMTLNGHVLGDGAGYKVSKTDLGNDCHQMLSNYQMRTLGGEGYLRLLEFHPDNETVTVKTFSTLYEKFMMKPDHMFQFKIIQLKTLNN